MDLDNAKQLKEQLLSEMYPDAPGGARGLRQQALPVRGQPAQQLSIGYSLISNQDYQLELRLKRRRGPAYDAAQKAKAKAEKEVNIAFVESLHVPSGSELIQAAARTAKVASFSGRRRPLHIGLSIGHGNGGPGSLGAFVQTSDGKDAVLSNCHVLAPVGKAKRGDPIYQPGREPQQNLLLDNVIATLTNSTAFSNVGSNYLDGAYAILEEGHDAQGNIVPEGCGNAATRRITSVIDYDELLPRQLVAKVGRTSGYTTGIVSSFGLDDIVIEVPNVGNTRFDNLLEISWDLDKRFSDEGDSGGLVFTAHSFAAVGLHFAGGVLSVNGKKMGFSYSCNLQYLLKIFDLEFIT
jgi:hypothetical protein